MPGIQGRPLRVGLRLPHAEFRYGGMTPRWPDILEMARLAEDVGFDSIWTIDHFILQYPDAPSQGLWECWSLLSALAASTRRVELGPLVTPTSFRNPALLAKMADTVDEISGGRIILGLGAGWVESEYRAMGMPFDHRVSRFEESISTIRDLLRHEDGDVLRPRGPRPQGPPIIVGSSGERMLRIAARYADGWNAFFALTGNTPAGIPPLQQRVDAACREVGRDPATFARTCAVYVAYDLPGATGHPKIERPLQGDPEQIAAELRAYADAGISHVQVSLDPMTPIAVEAFAPVLELLGPPLTCGRSAG
jgi:alkanesulfonate monooxygenase SsuD/methylene tetrahydromethanopterin reductase-like flavin-dependent oxidoreductase (luciferase family)